MGESGILSADSHLMGLEQEDLYRQTGSVPSPSVKRFAELRQGSDKIPIPVAALCLAPPTGPRRDAAGRPAWRWCHTPSSKVISPLTSIQR